MKKSRLQIGFAWGIGKLRSSKTIMLGLTAALLLTNFGHLAHAQEKSLLLELNRMEQQVEACRFDWRVSNQSSSRIQDLTADFVLFDKEGVNIARMSIPFGTLAREKSVLRSFQLSPFVCTTAGEVLFNDVAACTADPVMDCVAAVRVSSRAAVRLTR